MEILAKAKGLSKLRDAALLEVELIATIDPITTEAKASGRGRIKLPGHGQWIDIELPKLDRKRIDFRLDESRTVNEPPTIDKATLERIYELEFNLDAKADSPEIAKSPSETPQQPQSEDYSTPEPRFTRFNLTREQAISEIKRLRNEMKWNQTNIIKFLWDAKPGENEAYRNALSEYKELMG